jgi:hypothetical protein
MRTPEWRFQLLYPKNLIQRCMVFTDDMYSVQVAEEIINAKIKGRMCLLTGIHNPVLLATTCPCGIFKKKYCSLPI